MVQEAVWRLFLKNNFRVNIKRNEKENSVQSRLQRYVAVFW